MAKTRADKIREDVINTVIDVLTEQVDWLDLDEYHGGLIPEKKPELGWESTAPAWNELLKMIKARLKVKYGKLDIRMADAVRTVGIPVDKTIKLIIQKIQQD